MELLAKCSKFKNVNLLDAIAMLGYPDHGWFLGEASLTSLCIELNVLFRYPDIRKSNPSMNSQIRVEPKTLSLYWYKLLVTRYYLAPPQGVLNDILCLKTGLWAGILSSLQCVLNSILFTLPPSRDHAVTFTFLKPRMQIRTSLKLSPVFPLSFKA